MPCMNGTEPHIEIFKPFGEAFELMKKILFQPFDLKKWLVVGFAAWLASLGAGWGGNFNYPSKRDGVQKLNDAISQIPHPILVGSHCSVGCPRAGSDCPLCLVARTRRLYVCRLHREEPRRSHGAVA
jgi:hypothetical protein